MLTILHIEIKSVRAGKIVSLLPLNRAVGDRISVNPTQLLAACALMSRIPKITFHLSDFVLV